MRIERAKTLLRRSEKSITEIAYETGFGSIHYFSRYFKESVGITPNEYRTKNK
jgi:transcriptional regulator GlxA family with amidase domain